jgi:hypothetical protein
MTMKERLGASLGFHYQSLCGHSRNFASVNFEGFVRNIEGTDLVFNTESVPSNIS